MHEKLIGVVQRFYMDKGKRKIVAIIQARMGSTRLRGKTLMNISGKPLLQHIIERVRCSSLINQIIVATSMNKNDNAIVSLCDELRVECFRGNENDVLDRFYHCAKLFQAQIVVRVTADDPFYDPQVSDMVIAEILKNKKLDYVSNNIEPTFPEGIDVEVFTFHALARGWKEATKSSDREHVTPYMWRHPEIFKIKSIKNDTDLSSLRWTIDTPSDLLFAREVYNELYRPGTIFQMNDVLALLKRRPDLSEINYGVRRREGYIKSRMRD